MEWVVLGDPIVYLHKCSCEKFFTRNPWPHALFLFHRKPTGFYSCKTCVQLSANVVNEFPEHLALFSFFRQPSSKSSSIYWISTAWRMEPQPCFYISFSHCRKGATKCSYYGNTGFSIIIPQLMLLMQLANTVFSDKMGIAYSTLLLIVALDVLVVMLAVILFPFLWKD